mgnify:CR=1 FL=1
MRVLTTSVVVVVERGVFLLFDDNRQPFQFLTDSLRRAQESLSLIIHSFSYYLESHFRFRGT